ncbi:hypothetical protein GGI03_004881 [Coemansia sp. RSA 2337]|nr:hypothetical protein GGI08_004584 [Coemansia sp. S2]KAJ2461811.1 hypothetical protein GGI03_004881 [Coemansia sp. RSA 2337]
MVSQTEILSGQALQALLGPEFKGAMFQAATRLKVKLELSEDNLQQDVASADNIRKFVACIKGMLPYVQSIDIVCKGNYCYQEALACQRFERWLGMYFSPETTLRVYRSKMILPSNLVPAVSVAITNIGHIWKNDNEATLEYIHRLAPMLQTLAITYKTVNRTEKLFIDSNNELVVYPKLQSLTFTTWEQEKIRYRPVVENLVPFPKLKKLHINMEYPFGDDLLFRGNCETLEQLHIELDIQTIVMLKKYNVFTGNKFKRLLNISAECNTHRVGGDPFASFVFTNFVAGMSSANQALSFDDGSAMKYSVSNLTMCSDLARIMSLNLKNANLTLSQVIVLLHKMTLLTELKCEFAGLGSEYDRIPLEDRPNRARLSCVNGSKHFKHMTLLGYLVDMRNVAECAILLALACPKLANFSILESLKLEFNSEITRALEVEPYSLYADSVQHLLFKHVESEQ